MPSTKNITSNETITVFAGRMRRLSRAVWGLALVWIFSVACFAWLYFGYLNHDSGEHILRVRGLVVVDNNGTERVWIGAPVPEPITMGKRFPRGGGASGIILFDEEGNERSGYVTTDGYPNVFFTLDSLAKQHVLFMAEPQGDPTLMLWDGRSSFRLTVGSDAPALTLTQGGEEVFRAPNPKNGDQDGKS